MAFPYHPNLREPLIQTVTAALCASTADLGVWMGAGRRAIEQSWSKDADFAVTLTGALAELEWKAIDQFALPKFTHECLAHLSHASSSDSNSSLRLQILRVLAEFAKCGLLKDTDDAWRNHLATWIQLWLDDFQLCEVSVSTANA